MTTKAVYTDAMINELRTMGVIDYALATEFADKHEISVRSVVAKVRSLELPYQPKPSDEKVAKPKAEPKAAIVAEIESLLNVNFKSLDKMVVEDLVKLRTLIKTNM